VAARSRLARATQWSVTLAVTLIVLSCSAPASVGATPSARVTTIPIPTSPSPAATATPTSSPRVGPAVVQNVQLIAGDVRDPATAGAIVARLGRPADVVLSDLAPKLSGVRARDETRSTELVETTLALLPTLLRPGGKFVTKVFMGPGFDSLLARLRRIFVDVKTTRATATRPGSSELYAACIGHRHEISLAGPLH